jgi:hypothetical protein
MMDALLRRQLADASLALSEEFRWDAIAVRHLELYRRLGAV